MKLVVLVLGLLLLNHASAAELIPGSRCGLADNYQDIQWRRMSLPVDLTEATEGKLAAQDYLTKQQLVATAQLVAKPKDARYIRTIIGAAKHLRAIGGTVLRMENFRARTGQLTQVTFYSVGGVTGAVLFRFGGVEPVAAVSGAKVFCY